MQFASDKMPYETNGLLTVSSFHLDSTWVTEQWRENQTTTGGAALLASTPYVASSFSPFALQDIPKSINPGWIVSLQLKKNKCDKDKPAETFDATKIRICSRTNAFLPKRTPGPGFIQTETHILSNILMYFALDLYTREHSVLLWVLKSISTSLPGSREWPLGITDQYRNYKKNAAQMQGFVFMLPASFVGLFVFLVCRTKQRQQRFKIAMEAWVPPDWQVDFHCALTTCLLYGELLIGIHAFPFLVLNISSHWQTKIPMHLWVSWLLPLLQLSVILGQVNMNQEMIKQEKLCWLATKIINLRWWEWTVVSLCWCALCDHVIFCRTCRKN